jgi:hypothetical protein
MTKRRKRKRPDAPPDPIEDERGGLPSASGFDSEFRCPGKRALCKRLPREEDQAAAERGKRIHDALQAGDFSNLVENEQRTASRIAYGESEIVHEHGFEGAEVTFEERIWDFDDAFNRTWSGRVDRYDWQPDKRRLLIIDAKSGWTSPPPIHDNWQVRSEAALLCENFSAEEVVAGLIHPHHPESLWEAKVYTAEEMRHLLDIVRENVAAITPDARRIPGPIQCQWCEAKRICPEYKAASAELEQAIADEIADQGFTAINRRDKHERGNHVRALKEQMKNIEFILDQYVELAERDPDGVAGWRLARKMTRSVTNEIKAMDLARAEFGPDALYAALKFSLPALEAQLAKTATAKEAKASVIRVLGPLIKYTKSKNYLEEARSL